MGDNIISNRSVIFFVSLLDIFDFDMKYIEDFFEEYFKVLENVDVVVFLVF